MTTNAVVRAEVRRAIEASTDAVTVYATPPDVISSPAVILGGIDWRWDVLGAGRVVTIPLYVAVSRRNTNKIVELDELCDPDGLLISTFDADPTATGVDSWSVTDVGSYRDINIGDTDYYAATITLEVFC